MAGKSIITTSKLTKTYNKGAIKAVSELDLEIERGEIYGFLGPNGAGKTTTIRMLLNFINPDSGEVRIFGKDPTKERTKITVDTGYVPGDTALIENYKVSTYFDYMDYLQGEKSKSRDGLVERFKLDATRKIKNLSKGNKQKVAIIQALMHTPRLLIMDEPTIGLDPLLQLEFNKVVLEFKKKGVTIFFSSHVLSEVQRICDRVGIIKEGKLISVEKISELRKKNVYEIDLILANSSDMKKIKLEGISDIDRTDHSTTFTYKGDINKLVAELKKYKLIDLRIKEPDLEKLFLTYY
ncbi:MAG: ABC transporter ATP-binding protein [Candidatus Dojkabacteria bacterium]